MSALCCTAVKSNGQRCAARPLPGGDLCLFHDPAHQLALAQSRRQGGSTPRRRTCRYPLLLDYKHVAELLSEILVEAMNDPAAFDPQRLRALTGLANTLLKAVGRPKDSYELHSDRGEPAADEDHQLRIYPPEPPELASLLAADAEIEADENSLDPSAPTQDTAHTSPAPEAKEGWEQEREQVTNRSGTGAPATTPARNRRKPAGRRRPRRVRRTHGTKSQNGTTELYAA